MAGILVLATAGLVGVSPGGGSGPASAGPGDPPNLLLIVTDDARVDTLRVMPKTKARFDVSFTRGFVMTPLCCPSRATFLTGQQAFKSGVRVNEDYDSFKPLEPDSLGPWLQAQGYYTGFIGKYLNRYLRTDPTPPGWDEFYAQLWAPPVGDARPKFIGNAYTSFELREHFAGTDSNVPYPNPTEPEVYSTTKFGDLAERFLDRAAGSQAGTFNPLNKPWALLVWPNAPHKTALAEDIYANATIPKWPRKPSFMEKKIGDKPREIKRSWQRSHGKRYHRTMRRQMARAMLSVDDMVERIFDTMDALAVTENTWGVLTSDNGYFWGEHGMTEKRYAYEEAARVPFRMAVPGVGPRKITSMVANADIAPTFMELAEDPSDHDFDGKSLVPLIQGNVGSLRSALLIEGWDAGRYRAVRTGRWKYVRWPLSGHQELYDLLRDRFELRNIASRRPGVVRVLRRTLRALSRDLNQ